MAVDLRYASLAIISGEVTNGESILENSHKIFKK